MLKEEALEGHQGRGNAIARMSENEWIDSVRDYRELPEGGFFIAIQRNKSIDLINRNFSEINAKFNKV